MMSSHNSTMVKDLSKRPFWSTALRILIPFTVLTLTACYYPAPYRVISRPLPEDKGSNAGTAVTQVYFYPKTGQTPEQLERDRYECHNWAVKQAGFDPSLPTLPPEQRVTVVAVPQPGHDTVALGWTGAILGAILAGPRHGLGGAIVGATAGVIAGSASDAARQDLATQQATEINAKQNQARNAQLEEKALEYHRAMSACLEGRGYSVQ